MQDSAEIEHHIAEVELEQHIQNMQHITDCIQIRHQRLNVKMKVICIQLAEVAKEIKL